MGKPTGFMEYSREDPHARAVQERLRDYNELYPLLEQERLRLQAARCMDCGVPFCQGSGCPLQNLIPEFNDLVWRGAWREALEVLLSTDNFPEFTGKICPALCEGSCVAALGDQAVSIRQIELQIIERGWEQGWIVPRPPAERTGKAVAVVGSGPAGLAAADQLNQAGHRVVVFEQRDRPGGLLRYGIPDFKLDKRILDRRLRLMQQEGVEFETSVRVGRDIAAGYLARQFDALCLAGGAMVPRDLAVPGRDLGGIHFAMEFLEQQNRRVAGDTIPEAEAISAAGKRVVVIGGGDTGADCVGTSNRQGARQVIQLEILPQPPQERLPENPWPQWPQVLRTSSSHEEGCLRRWAVLTLSFSGRDGRVERLRAVEVSFDAETNRFVNVPGTEFELEAELVLLAMGFVQPVREGMLTELALETDRRGNVQVDRNMMTSRPGTFSAGDMASGASLVVRAISQGRRAARGIDLYLMGETVLP